MLTSLPVLPRASSRINDNHCYNRPQGRLLAGSTSTEQTLNSNLNVNLHVVTPVPFAHGPPQKKVSPGVSDCHLKRSLLNSVKGVSCVTQLSCVNPVTNVTNAAQNLPVGTRLQNFWQTWLDLGAHPKVVQILREGYTLPFRTRPRLARFPTVVSCYVNPHRNSYLLEALHQLIDKNAVELVKHQTSLGFFNRLFLVPKPNNKWRPILDLSKLNLFLKTEKFKMETPETIRTSLQQEEWVTSIDFKDAYFHIPIQEQSRKYLRFHVEGRTYQFKALPFGLSTAPLEFTVVAKEVKLMAIHKGIRIHQYLDDWLVRARSYQACLQHTRILLEICQKLGWLVNMDKSELELKQVFDFVGYQFDLKDRWRSLQQKLWEILSLPACPVRQFMSLIGLLTATEKQVHLGRLHMRPIQWHLKSHWRIPESLEKAIPIPRSLHPHLQWWLQEDNVLTGQPLHPIRHALQIFTDASKEGWGAHLNEHTARKQTAYKLFGTQGSVSRPQRVPKLLYKPDGTCGNRQHYSDVVHKQRRRHEVGPSLCPTMENLDLVYQTSSKSPAHSGAAKRGSRQALPFRTDHSDRMVPPPRGVSSYMPQVAPTSDRSVCHEVQPQVTSLRITGTGPLGSSSGCTQSPLGGSGRIRFPPSSHLGQSGGEATGLPLQ